MTWQPIETAPRDRRILLWDEQCVIGKCSSIASLLKQFGMGEWVTDVGDGIEPTAWQPLPDKMASDVNQSSQRMTVCETCGNKRCPHAEDKSNLCTGSNELGQVGVKAATVETKQRPGEVGLAIQRMREFKYRPTHEGDRERRRDKETIVDWVVESDLRAVPAPHCPSCENWSAQYARQADELVAAKGELAMWKPMTTEEAEAALAEVVSEPISDERIEAIVAKVTDPSYRPSEPEHVLLAGKVVQLKVELTELKSRLAETEGQLRQSHHVCCNYHERAVGECNCVSVMKGEVSRAESAEQRAEALQAQLNKLRENAAPFRKLMAQEGMWGLLTTFDDLIKEQALATTTPGEG